MPFWALAMNITWEGIYAITDLRASIGIQPVVNLLWFLFDIVILYFYLKFGKKELEPGKKAWVFYAWSILGILGMLAVQISFIAEFGLKNHLSAQYPAFIQNLIMSIAFINMLHKRKSSDGQSILLAAAKWIGTLAPTITMGILSTNYVVLVCGLLCSIYDIMYIILLYKTKNPAASNGVSSLLRCRAAGFLTLAAFVKFPCKHGYFPHCSRE